MGAGFTNMLARSARDLGGWIGDPDRALPGEDPRTSDARLATHWASVHFEVLELRLELLRHLRHAIETVSDPCVAAGLQHNARSLELAVNRSRRRSSHWAQRASDLA